MRAWFLITAAIFLPVSVSIAGSRMEKTIQEAFESLRELHSMRPGETYSVEVKGAIENGPKDQFLRRRTPSEVIESKLSSGCGDNALVFLERMERAGFDVLLIDSAEISSASLMNNFSGHAVVAVREKPSPEKASWHLVDPTNMKVISDKWSRDERSFEAFGRFFWIGYCGPATDYQIHTPEELKNFYALTLSKVPPTVLASRLIKLNFDVNPSMMKPDGSFLNPRLSHFLEMQDSVLRKYEIQPTRTVSIVLKRGADDARSTLSLSEGRWIAVIGADSGLSLSLLDYMERTVRRPLQTNSTSE